MSASSSAAPQVAVVMPLYNAARFVESAVDSVLGQGFSDFELVVVDDGSDDGGPELVSAFTDPRVRLMRLPVNGGIAAALNAGISATSAPIIARMDADDVSLPGRFEQQLAFLDENPDVGIVGCTPLLLDESGRALRPFPVLTSDRELRRLLSLQGPFCHGSVMFRREVFERAGPYRGDEEPAEDYALWIRMAGFTKLANLAVPLYGLRLSAASVSATSRQRQLSRRNELRDRAHRELGGPDLRWRELRAERRRYATVPGPQGALLTQAHLRQHRELAWVELRRRPLVGWRGLGVALGLGGLGPRAAAGLLRFARNERRERQEASGGLVRPL